MSMDEDLLRQFELEKAKCLANDPTAKDDTATALPPGVKLSPRAVPPILPGEIVGAVVNAVCPGCGGDILRVWKHRLNDMHGRVYFCRVGGQYWRLHYPWAGEGLKLPPLKYPWRVG